MNFWQTLTNVHKNLHISWWHFFLLCIFFISLSFGQLGRMEVGEAAFYAHDVVILVWLAAQRALIESNLSQFLRNLSKKSRLSLMAFVLWVLLGMAVAFLHSQNLTPFLYLLRLSAYIIFIVSLFSRHELFRLIVKTLLISSGMYMIAFGLLQYVLIPDSRYLFLFGWDEHYYRLIGPLLDPNLSGMVYVIAGWVIVAFRNKLPRNLWVTLLLLAGTAIVLTYSRATYLAAVVSIIYFFFLQKHFLKPTTYLYIFTIIVALAGLVYYLAPKPGGEGINLFRTASILARINSSQDYLTNLQPYQWVLGTGFYSPLRATAITSHAQAPDNILITLFVQTGIIGTFLFFTLLTHLMSWLKKLDREILAALVALLIHSQFNNSLLEPFIFLIMGITLITHLKTRQAKGSTL